MECQSCKHINRADAKFCSECGTALEKRCTGCSTLLESGAKFCAECGTPVSGKPVAPAKASRASEGERRVVTVLFADAVGHTPISEQLDEEDVYNLMQGCFARMQAAVEKYGGTVNQFTGDGILALFGAPIAYEDSARRAVAAALELQASLTRYASDVKQKYPIECSYRVGLNTGPIVLGKISDTLDLEVAAIGDTVNLASRMETLAESGTVYLSENTYRAVKDYFECADLGPHDIKGKSRPVGVYRTVREKVGHSRIEISIERGLTPYVGRDQEQTMLHSFLEKAHQGQGQVMLISGEAGIGKSRTLLEFRRSIGESDLVWLGGQCISFGDTTPYLSAIDVLKASFGIREADLGEDITRKVDEGVTGWRERDQESVPYIKYLLNVEHNDPALDDMDPMERRAGFLDAFRTIVHTASRESTLVIVIEDLHWIDEHSEVVIENLVEMVNSRRILLLLTARPGYRHSISARSYFSQVALSQLRREDSNRLTEEALGATNLPQDLLKLIGEKAEGNPFYIEEVVRSLVDTGVIAINESGMHTTQDLSNVKIPDSIHDVILSRIDRLAPEARGAMQLASVIGREFTARLLNRISDLEDRLDDTLNELKSLELIYETGYVSELAYMFKHALTHDVAYSTLLLEHRRKLHRTVAMAIETLYAERLTEHYEALAYHYEQAQEYEEALEYLIKSGEKAAGTYSNKEAIAFFGRALAICDRFSDEKLTTIVHIAQQRAAVHDCISDFHGAIDDLNRVIAAGQATGNRYLQGITMAYRSHIEWQLHEFDVAEATSLAALELAGTDLPGVKFAALVTLWLNVDTTGRHPEAVQYVAEIDALAKIVDEPLFQALWGVFYPLRLNWSGRYDEAAQVIEQLDEMIHATSTTHVASEWMAGLALAGAGRYEDALQRLTDSLRFTERISNIFFAIRITNTIGWVYTEIQDLDKAIEWNTRGIAAAQENESLDSEVESNARLNLADNLMDLGRLDEAEKHITWVDTISRNPKPEDRMAIHNYSAHCFHSFGELHLRRGELDSALTYAEDCIDVARISERGKNEVKGLRLKGQALHRMNQLEEASVTLHKALDIARQVQNPPQLWKTWKAIGELYEAQGNSDGAQAAYSEALSVMNLIAEGLNDERRTIFENSAVVIEVKALAG